MSNSTMKLETIFIAVFLFASGLFAGCACGYYLIPRVVVHPPNDPHLRHRAIHVRPVNPVFEPLIEEDFPPGAQRSQYASDPKNSAHGL